MKTYTLEEARERVISFLNQDESSPYLQLQDELTVSKEYGWIFFYNSVDYIATGSLSDCLAGNAPLIFNKSTGMITTTGTAMPLECYVKEYESRL